LSEFNIDLSKYKKEPLNNDINTVVYESQDDGLSFWTVNGVVSSISYTPTSKDRNLLCPTQPEPRANKINLPSFPYDRYGNLSLSEERQHLDLLAQELKEHPATTQVYIVVCSAPPTISKDEAQERAERAKDYLVKTYSISPNRIRIINGGRGKSFEAVVYIVPINSP
jgi:hypothetical protein